MSRRRVHFVLSTHWDREWHRTFQDFRYRLVRLMDHVLDGLADGRLQGPFVCDGQAVVIEDYLEVRPERRAQIEQFAREGKLIVGPWYVLPDEFLVSGESLVRNLRRGRDLARAMNAPPSNAGFVCDMFGHNSQLPQILAGFGIRAGFIWRGINQIETRHVRWRGADGSELVCFRFGHAGYCSYAHAVRSAFAASAPFDARQVAENLDAFLDFEAEHTEIDPILLFDGGDHQDWDENAYNVLLERMAREDDRYEIVHTSLDAYLEEMLAQADRIAAVAEGELREPGRHPLNIDQQWLIPGVLSSRVWIKQQNTRCQALLCHWAEPLSALAHVALGDEYPEGHLNVAWRWLLKNHAHDSICGCSIDQVHEDMKYRFSQCLQIGERLTDEATRRLAANVTGGITEEEIRVVVFNPLPQAVDEVVDLTLPLPDHWATFNEFFGFEPKPAFRMYDAEGTELPYQRLAQAPNRTKVRLRATRFPEAYRTHDVTVALPLRVPAMGYTTLTVRNGEPRIPTRYPDRPSLVTGERSMQNEYLAVAIENNGTLTVTDRRTGNVYTRLLTYEDVADIGDGWFHGQAVNDQACLSGASPADITLLHDGPMMAAFRIRTVMSVPAEFDFNHMGRSPQRVDLVIESQITLRRGVDRLEVSTTLENVAGDHRLRVLFPSGVSQATTYLADSPYDVVERPIALREDNHLYRELEVETRPQQSWTAVYGTGRGLAVVADGLLEAAVRDLPERPIALTLFRATRRTVMTDGEPDGQLFGPLSFRYWIVPLPGEPGRARLSYLGQYLTAGLRAVPMHPADMAVYRTTGSLPSVAGLLEMEGAAIITSVRRVAGALEVRFFNPLAAPMAATLRFGGENASWPTPTQAQRVNLESAPLADPEPVTNGVFEVAMKPKEIVTLRLT